LSWANDICLTFESPDVEVGAVQTEKVINRKVVEYKGWK
jgi:hypothetical protein